MPSEVLNPTLKKHQMSAIKVVKYLFISTLILLIIGAIVLFGLAIDDIISSGNSIHTIQRYGITELAFKHSERLKQQKLSSLLAIIINLLIILLSCFGVIAIIKDNFLLIMIFAITNTITLLVSLWSTTSKAAIILLQIAVSLFAFSYTLAIYWKMKIEIKKRQKQDKEIKNNKKNSVIQNHKHQNNNHENNNTKANIV